MLKKILNNTFRPLITSVLEAKAKKLIKTYKPKIVAVVGSVGKTSTKLAIATVLSERYKVLAHFGSYNVPVAVPMSIFDMKIPLSIRNPFSWLKVIGEMNRIIKSGDYPYQVLVLELGTDHPGEIGYFRRYLKPDVAVVTAVSPEHMEGFGTLDAVAKEELTITEYAKLTLINRDDVSGVFAKDVPDGINIDTYGTSGVAEYRFVLDSFEPGKGFTGKFVSPEYGQKPIKLQVVGEHNVRTAVAAGAVGVKLGLAQQQVLAGMQKIRPVPGRMNLLRGMLKSTIIDDTYNSSPLATVAALQTLYQFKAPQRIAILGSMNEMGDYSKTAHEEVAMACDPGMLDWVVTVGAEAKKYMAPLLQKRGVRTEVFMDPYKAGAFVHKVMQKNAVILAKGSQNGVFCEEAVKMLLHSTEEEAQLIRQDPEWMAIKQKQFGNQG
jgi:UDP-N-acetylmuramoyl-tripeptide--D-alanyl-D-alanine ligase